MRREVIVESATLLLLGLIGAWGGLDSYLKADTRTLSSSMQPGVYVLVISVALMLTALVYGWAALRAASATSSEPTSDAGGASATRTVALVFAAVALYALLIPLIGYLPSTVLFLLAEFRLLGVESWRRNAILTLVAAALFYVVFVQYGEMVFPHATLFAVD
jgi:putative tricarboxylic transport membrane protein